MSKFIVKYNVVGNTYSDLGNGQLEYDAVIVNGNDKGHAEQIAKHLISILLPYDSIHVVETVHLFGCRKLRIQNVSL